MLDKCGYGESLMGSLYKTLVRFSYGEQSGGNRNYLWRLEGQSVDTFQQPIVDVTVVKRKISNSCLYEPLSRATIVQPMLYSFLSRYLDSAEQNRTRS